MSQARVGEKRGSDTEFIPGLTLSQHPPQQRKSLFMKKFGNIKRAMSMHPTELEGYMIRECFEGMGWGQLLNFSCDKIYKRVVIQWVKSLSRNGDELTGIVNGKAYTITPLIIRDLLGVDTRKDLPYARFNEADLQTAINEVKRRWLEARKTVFGIPENANKIAHGYGTSNLTPLVQVLWKIGMWTFLGRVEVYDTIIYPREIYLLHALVTGDCLYSFAHLMIDDIWDMYEHEHRPNIPHGYYISEILNQLGAVSKDEHAHIIPPQHRLITRTFFTKLEFSESSTEYIIDDCGWNMQRVTFPKKVIEQEAPCRVTQKPSPKMSPRMHATNLQTPSQSQTQHGEMMTMLTNIQKQMDRQAIEAERRSHAIIWDIERQRYFYEKEQEELHRVWKQAYGSDAFQYPQIGHTSFHPPQAGSRYYDPTQGNEIPKAFQDIFQDIYGKKP